VYVRERDSNSVLIEVVMLQLEVHSWDVVIALSEVPDFFPWPPGVRGIIEMYIDTEPRHVSHPSNGVVCMIPQEIESTERIFENVSRCLKLLRSDYTEDQRIFHDAIGAFTLLREIPCRGISRVQTPNHGSNYIIHEWVNAPRRAGKTDAIITLAIALGAVHPRLRIEIYVGYLREKLQLFDRLRKCLSSNVRDIGKLFPLEPGVLPTCDIPLGVHAYMPEECAIIFLRNDAIIQVKRIQDFKHAPHTIPTVLLIDDTVLSSNNEDLLLA
jgi:hypothetical protein